MESFLLPAALFLLLTKTLVEGALAWVNQSALRKATGQPPPSALAHLYEGPAWSQALAYTAAKQRLGWVELAVGAAIGAVLVGGGLAALYGWVTGWWGGLAVDSSPWWQALAVFVPLTVLGVLDWPIEWYATFRLEARFGFNKTTPALWVADQLKGLVLGALLGLPVLAAVFWILANVPLWWVWAAVTLIGFQILVLFLYPVWIAPLFNKFSPLPEGALRTELLALAERLKFPLAQVMVVDGSKRSLHANAYFTGFGRFRRAVLYDTLLQQLAPTPLAAVLAHEIGHQKLGHIPKLLLINCLMVLGLTAAVAWVVATPAVPQAFGLPATPAAAVLLVALVGPWLLFWVTPLTNALARRHEYEADAFAREALQGDPAPLVEALRQLHTKNLSNPVPHPAYSAFYYSHPTLPERERALHLAKSGAGGA